MQRKIVLLSTAAMLAFLPAVALAQSSPAPADDVAPASAEPDIVVTGSRIGQSATRSATPIVTLSAEAIALTGRTDAEGIINQLPMAAPQDGATNNDGGGIATVDLRGLGPSRTLVLVNGRRYVAANTNQVVDLNTIPLALIERVDVVTGGRSAVYGSDAVAGVVNFTLKQNFSGLQADATSGVTSHGDGAQQSVSLTGGVNTADGKGNITLFGSYGNRDAIRGDARKFSAKAYNDVGDGSLFVGGSAQVAGGRLVNVPGGSQIFRPDGSLTPYSFERDAFNYDADLYNQLPNERWLAAGSAHYSFSPAATLFAEGQYVKSDTRMGLPATGVGGFSTNVQVNSPFLPASSQAFFRALDTGNTGYYNVGISRRFVELPVRTIDFDHEAYRGVLGLRGDLGASWHYEAYYSHAHNKATETGVGGLSSSRLSNATNTVFADPATLSSASPTLSPFPITGLAGGGTLVCASAAARSAGCVPANIYGANRMSAAAASYLSAGFFNSATMSTDVANLTLTNKNLFDMPGGGPVGVAVGAEYRREAAQFRPDPVVASGDIQGFVGGNPTGGSYNVKEVFAEADVPLLQDQPFAKLLDFNFAARYSDYSTGVGSVLAYSAGGLYRPVSDIGFRAQYQRAVRGPNVNELFQGASQGSETTPDPCNMATTGSSLAQICVSTGVPAALIGTQFNARPQYFSIHGGSTGLSEEKSSTYTAGVVITPSFVPRLTLSADYYNISIDGYLGNLGAANILGLCYAGNSRYCGLIARNALTGEIDTVNDRTANSGGFKTSGIDFAASYIIPLGGDRNSLSLNSQVTRLLSRAYTPVSDIPDTRNVCAGLFGATCGQPSPKWRAVSRATLTEGAFTASVQWQYIGSSTDDGTLGYQVAVPRLPAKNYFDLSGAVKISERFTFTLGVNNIFNVEPVIMGDNDQFDTANTWPALYDVVGRRFFAGVSARF